MLRWLVLVVFVLPVAGCHAGEPPRAPLPASAPPAATPSPAPTPTVSSCHAGPATVYGEEPVAFHLQAPSAGLVEVTLTDELGRPALKSTVAVPGRFEPPALPSGDFTLRVSDGPVSCVVTVNRELARASPASR